MEAEKCSVLNALEAVGAVDAEAPEGKHVIDATDLAKSKENLAQYAMDKGHFLASVVAEAVLVIAAMVLEKSQIEVAPCLRFPMAAR